MARLKTNGRKKLRKAQNRIDKVVIMEIRKMIEQQRKRKAKVFSSRSSRADAIKADAIKADAIKADLVKASKSAE